MKNALVLSQSEAHNFFMYIIKIITIITIDIIYKYPGLKWGPTLPQPILFNLLNKCQIQDQMKFKRQMSEKFFTPLVYVFLNPLLHE